MDISTVRFLLVFLTIIASIDRNTADCPAERQAILRFLSNQLGYTVSYVKATPSMVNQPHPWFGTAKMKLPDLIKDVKAKLGYAFNGFALTEDERTEVLRNGFNLATVNEGGSSSTAGQSLDDIVKIVGEAGRKAVTDVIALVAANVPYGTADWTDRAEDEIKKDVNGQTYDFITVNSILCQAMSKVKAAQTTQASDRKYQDSVATLLKNQKAEMTPKNNQAPCYFPHIMI